MSKSEPLLEKAARYIRSAGVLADDGDLAGTDYPTDAIKEGAQIWHR